jgi:hypothetical protein
VLTLRPLDGDDRRGQFLRTVQRLHVEALVIDQAGRGGTGDDRRGAAVELLHVEDLPARR